MYAISLLFPVVVSLVSAAAVERQDATTMAPISAFCTPFCKETVAMWNSCVSDQKSGTKCDRWCSESYNEFDCFNCERLIKDDTTAAWAQYYTDIRAACPSGTWKDTPTDFNGIGTHGANHYTSLKEYADANKANGNEAANSLTAGGTSGSASNTGSATSGTSTASSTASSNSGSSSGANSGSTASGSVTTTSGGSAATSTESGSAKSGALDLTPRAFLALIAAGLISAF